METKTFASPGRLYLDTLSEAASMVVYNHQSRDIALETLRDVYGFRGVALRSSSLVVYVQRETLRALDIGPVDPRYVGQHTMPFVGC